MHVKAKQVAFLGLLAAVVSILMILASVIKTSTLFLLAAAAFLVGVAIREYGIRIGFGFFVACILLGFLLSPNKLYVFTYAGFSLYILWDEVAYSMLAREFFQKHRRLLFMISKFLLFNLLYLSVLYLFPKIIFAGEFSAQVWIMLILAGQIGWIIYDKAYEYFQIKVWGKVRHKLGFGLHSNE
jgi:hypothetical protein